MAATGAATAGNNHTSNLMLQFAQVARADSMGNGSQAVPPLMRIAPGADRSGKRKFYLLPAHQ
jgi:hypothetical protein